MAEALIWVYDLRDGTQPLNPLVAVVVCGTHVCTVGISDPSRLWNTTAMSAIEDAHEPLAHHAERMEEHGYTLLVAPRTVELAADEVDELDPGDRVKKFLTLRVKRMIAGAK